WDIAAVSVACLAEDGHEGRTYVLTGAKAITHAEAAEKLSALLMRRIAYVDIPPPHLVQGLKSAGYPEWLASDLAKLGEQIAAGDFEHTTDVVRAVAKKNPITFDEFIRDNASSFA